MNPSTPIFILGYMACGKTTLGRALARRLHRQFIDLDFYIEQRFRRSITDIFRDFGEERFREMEASMLREAGEMENVVIACGGGTPCFSGNIDYMNSRGLTVYLNTSQECILRRLIVNRRRRPLLANMDEMQLRLHISEHIAQRLPYYTKARVHFPGDDLEDKCQIDATVTCLLALPEFGTD